MAAGESRLLVSAVRSIANPNAPEPACSSLEREQKAEQQLTSFADLEGLVKSGLVTNASINPAGPGNTFVAGLRPTRAIINCPVIGTVPRRT
jgi:ribosome-binding ATPase YchF (GTP1/OBG family)